MFVWKRGIERLLISLFRSLKISSVIGALLRSTKLLNLIFQKFLIKTHKIALSRSTEMSIMLSTFRHFLFSLNILSAFKCLPLVVVLVLQRVSHLFEWRLSWLRLSELLNYVFCTVMAFSKNSFKQKKGWFLKRCVVLPKQPNCFGSW